MNSLPRHTLTRLIAKHGRGICDSPKRIEALLRDLCGSHRREINILIGALEERVATDLIRTGKSVPRDVLLAKLANRLQDNRAYTPEAASWAVDGWAVALGILSESEFAARARSRTANMTRSTLADTGQTDSPSTSIPSGQQAPSTRQANDQTRNPPSTSPSRTTPRVTPLQHPIRPSPHVNAQRPATTQRPLTTSPPSVVSPRPSHAKTISPATSANNVLTQQQPLTMQQPERRGLKLGGCLFTLLFLIVLVVGAVFVVPAIIAILREEQAQPSVNDRQFP